MYFLYVRLELDFRKRLNNIVPFIAHYTIALPLVLSFLYIYTLRA